MVGNEWSEGWVGFGLLSEFPPEDGAWARERIWKECFVTR